MNDLNEIKWDTFRVKDLFDLHNGKCSNMEDYMNKNKGEEIPFIGATHRNNGVVANVKRTEDLVSKGNALVFIKTGQGSSGRAIYKAEDFIGHTNISVGYNKNLNKHTGNFIVTIIDSSRSRYNYGYGRNDTRLMNEKLLLPIKENNEPHWEFMEQFMKDIEKEIKPELIYQEHKIFNFQELNEVNWLDFFIEDLFYVQRGRRLIKKKQIRGYTPYVSSTGLANGVDNMIGNKDNVRFFKNCLTIANSGSVGNVFYHPYTFIASDHVTHIISLNEKLSKYSYLFIATMLGKIQSKYSFNREISDKRLKREKIMLPINDMGEPHWIFMEQYMKRIENKWFNEAKIKEDSTLYSKYASF